EVIKRHGGETVSVGNPTTTLEDLFLKIIRQSEEHPGRRVRGDRASGDRAGEDAAVAEIVKENEPS
ncbi:MAG: hypothetical protein V3V75_01575, partial [Thermoguttaceae bacterium]